MVKFVRALRRHPTLWVGPRFPYIWEIPCSLSERSVDPDLSGLQGSSMLPAPMERGIFPITKEPDNQMLTGSFLSLSGRDAGI